MDYPILVFPEPTPAVRHKLPGGGGKVRYPNPSQQAERLTPKFQRLQEVMDKKRLTLQDNPTGIKPEQVLVIETIDSVNNFWKAVTKITGLEWLNEHELNNIPSDYGFENEKKPNKELKGQLLLIMTDQQALKEIKSLFQKWKLNPNDKFPKGLAPLKHLFHQLLEIRPWDETDRIKETGILEDWKDRLRYDQNIIPFEAELWFRQNKERREQAEINLSNFITLSKGKINQRCVIPQIAYHAVLGQIQPKQIQELIDDPKWYNEILMLQCDDLMYLRPVCQSVIHISDDTTTGTLQHEQQAKLPKGDPIVALFDGMPLTNHSLLKDRLLVDDPDDFGDKYQTSDRKHGTAMASLICHGDLNESNNAIEKPLYTRPIMKPQYDYWNQSHEILPFDVLTIDLIHRAVRRLFESDNNQEPAVVPSIRVINLSLGDNNRPLGNQMSSWARLLDWLSWKYNVLFIVSAGNHSYEIELKIARASLSDLTDQMLEQSVIEFITNHTRKLRLLSPAETLNGLTIGAMHSDSSTSFRNNLIDPFPRDNCLPSVISAHGLGYRRAIKPEIFFPGGKIFMAEKEGTDHKFAILQHNYNTKPPGQSVAATNSSGDLNKIIHLNGTSNSTALASRAASLMYELIEQIRHQSKIKIPSGFEVVLIKALLVHGADWGNSKRCFEFLKNDKNRRSFKEYIGRFLGYGMANVSKVMSCTEQRVTVLGFGLLDDGEGAAFHLPLPTSLSGLKGSRRLTVTLAWISPVYCLSQKYRIAHLWCDSKNTIANKRVCADYHAVQRGTVQHEIFEGDDVVYFENDSSIKIQINCRADANDIPAPIRFGLAVTLEVSEELNIPIYQEVRNQLNAHIPVQNVRL